MEVSYWLTSLIQVKWSENKLALNLKSLELYSNPVSWEIQMLPVTHNVLIRWYCLSQHKILNKL